MKRKHIIYINTIIVILFLQCLFGRHHFKHTVVTRINIVETTDFTCYTGRVRCCCSIFVSTVRIDSELFSFFFFLRESELSQAIAILKSTVELATSHFRRTRVVYYGHFLPNIWLFKLPSLTFHVNQTTRTWTPAPHQANTFNWSPPIHVYYV